MSSADGTTELSSLLESNESLEYLPPLTRALSEQEPDWLKNAANKLASSEDEDEVPDLAAAAAALQRSEKTLGLIRSANKKLIGERQATAAAALAAAEQHAENCARTQAGLAAARTQAQRVHVTAKAAIAWSRLSAEAAHSVAQAEVARVHAALAVLQQHAAHSSTARWVRAGASAARATAHAETEWAQATLAASAGTLERVRQELRASREAGEAGEVGEAAWILEAIRAVEASEAARGAAPAFFTAVATLRHGLAQLRVLELDEVDAGLIELTKRGGSGAAAELYGLWLHATAVARAAVTDCEQCAAAGCTREIRVRRRTILRGVPAAVAYAAVAAVAMLGHLLLFAAVFLRLMARRHGPATVVPAQAQANTDASAIHDSR